MSRNSYLDYVRAIAIILVVIYHSFSMAGCSHWFFTPLIKLGFYAVDLFFVLSGFLIGRLVFREVDTTGQFKMRQFILRRITRTLPLYYFVFGLLCIYLVLTKTPIYTAFFVFLQNYFFQIPYYSISWSLCVEEHFYLLFPLLYSLLLAVKNLTVKKVVIAIIGLLPLCWRAYHYFQGDINPAEFGYFYTATHLRYEGLIYGVLMAYYVNADWVKRLVHYRVPLVVATVLIYLLPVAVKNLGYLYTVHYTLITGSLALCLGVFHHLKPQPQTFSNRFIYQIAIQSYSTYLVHSLVIKVVLAVASKLGIQQPYGLFVIMCIGSFVAGSMLYHVIEKWLLSLREKLFSSHVPTA